MQAALIRIFIPMAEPIVTVTDLSIHFSSEKGKSAAVSNLNFSIAPGELLAIVGESGSGKSLSALSLLQLLPPEASITGMATFQQNDVKKDLYQLNTNDISSIRGNRIAMIFQEPMTSLNPLFTCGEQVSESIRWHQQLSKKAAHQKVIELFDQVKLPEPETLYQRYPHQLSGGQKQRVMIAMAIANHPALLIADEPTTALDVTVQQSIIQLIKELQQKNGMGVLFITHDLALVADIADKVIVMKSGLMVESGEPRNVLKHPQIAYTKALIACRPRPESKGKYLPTVADDMDASVDAVIREFPAPVSDPSKTILDIRHLYVSYPVRKRWLGKATSPAPVLQDISFSVFRGETVGIVGESGSGKTTLGKTILQLVQPDEGSIQLNGIDLKLATGKAWRRETQIVFQDPYGSLNPRMMIGQALTEPMEVHQYLNNKEQRKARAVELLEKVNLSADYFYRYPHQLSGGQRQRICIARALAINPSFLVFDESVSALDVSVQAQVLNLIQELKASMGFSAIFISHDLSVVHYICDRILVMQQGKIVESGNANELFYSPQNEYTKKLLSAIPGTNG